MIDATYGEEGVEVIPVRGFIGMNEGARRDAVAGDDNAVRFRFANEGERPALALAKGDDDAALAGLVLREAAVNAPGGNSQRFFWFNV